MDKDGIAITGLGLITPLGRNIFENWANLEQQKTGIGFSEKMSRFNPFHYQGQVGSFEIPQGVPAKVRSQMKFLNRGALLGFTAAYEAVASSKLNMTQLPPERKGLVVGAGDYTKTGYDFLFPAVKKGTGGSFADMDHKKLNKSALYEVHPFYLLESLHNNLFSFLSSYYDLKGPNASFASLSPCGLQALEAGARMVRLKLLDMALVVGCGSWITEIPMHELSGLGLLSHCRKGAKSFKPLDNQRNGFIPGEGGAAVLLEPEKLAERRGARIYGRLLGMGNCIEFENPHDLQVSSKNILRCMELALEDANARKTDIGFICPHGNATRKGDRSELESIAVFLENRLSEIPVTALKAYTGHMGAASDVAELILGIKGLQKQTAPGTLHFEATEKRFSRLNISSHHLPCNKNQFLSVSCGVGGQVGAAVIGSVN